MDPCHLLRGLQQGVGGGGQSGAARGQQGGDIYFKGLRSQRRPERLLDNYIFHSAWKDVLLYIYMLELY